MAQVQEFEKALDKSDRAVAHFDEPDSALKNSSTSFIRVPPQCR